MPAGRPRKPTKLLELVGAFKHNPDRALDRAEEPVPSNAIGEPPEKMTVAAKKMWREQVAMWPAGVLFDTDRAAMEQMCELYVRAQRKRFDVPAKDLMRLEAMYARFGMTPADRTRIKVAQPDKKPDTPYGEFGKKAAA